jgi:hypothetical protein
MNKLLLLFSSILCICCDNQDLLDIEQLKNNGYIETTCSSIESYKTEFSSFIEVNKKLSHRKSYLIARCFDKDSCLINIKIETDKIVCQRYIISLEEEDKRDYMNSNYKEFFDHRVLYLSVDSKNAKKFINRVN